MAPCKPWKKWQSDKNAVQDDNNENGKKDYTRVIP